MYYKKPEMDIAVSELDTPVARCGDNSPSSILTSKNTSYV
jgi:hypothetical protein